MKYRLDLIKNMAETFRNHLWGILNVIILKASNAPAESINSCIKTVKVRSRGFWNNQRHFLLSRGTGAVTEKRRNQENLIKCLKGQKLGIITQTVTLSGFPRFLNF